MTVEVEPLGEWDGDVQDLSGHLEELLLSQSLCEETFATKHEAFAAGVALGERSAKEQ